MAKFNLTQLLGNGSGIPATETPTANLDYKITHLSVYDLEPSLDNFYSVEQITELKASIAVFGIKQNLVVIPSATGKYRVIAGHRRRLAVLSLLSDGMSELERVPCIVETDKDELRERLLLITTNSTTRKLSDWELIRQAAELKSILSQIKQRDGIPGRLRDLIASALDTSPSQVARMEAIDKNLSPEFKTELKEERVNLSTAYELSGLPAGQQQEAYADYQERGSLSIKEVRELKQEPPSPPPAQPDEPPAPPAPVAPVSAPTNPPLHSGDIDIWDSITDMDSDGQQADISEFVPDVPPIPPAPVQTERVHELKTLPCYYADVESRVKPFEVRFNDRDYRVGDILRLLEWSEADGFTGCFCTREVTYILDDPRYVKEGFIIMGLR